MSTVVSHRTNKRYGWIPDLPDHRDLAYSAGGVKTPTKIDLTDGMPPVYNQLQLGSCTANAWAAVLDYERKAKGEAFMTPSRLFIYFNERDIEGTTNSDAGAMGRDGVKSMAKLGVCPEKEWPYDPSQFAVRPSTKDYTDAIKFEVLTYKRVTHTIACIKAALAEKHPIAFGFTVYESFEGDDIAKTGIMPMPKKSESVIGGHEVAAVGYDDATQMVKCRNSWGKDWGDAGYFYMPYKYITGKLASDFWILETVK